MIAATSGAFYLLALACPLGMGAMMLFMGKKRDSTTSGLGRDKQPLADLKAEQARLAEKISSLERRSEDNRVEETESTPA